ncbi:MAG: xanthine dehydrogenase family protein subunit M [Chloroflexota bacterium]|nr:xanthine dehydrogenase family protein subunit M [Chloroflexota bacterium]MDE3193761.1 xanthine dehydrogenase family protein subunit M [Chloroflexota bacterium]
MSFELHRPRSLDEALTLLEKNEGAHVMAGATALVLLMRQGLVRPSVVVSLRDAGLGGIRAESDGALWLGATTTIREAEESPLVRSFCPALAEAFGHVATVRVRDQATVGGNLAHADPAQDPPPMLLALGAEVELAKAGRKKPRRIPVEELLVGLFETSIEEGEILTGVRVPPLPAGTRATYVKFLPRTEDDYATVSVAAVGRVTNGALMDARIALGSVGPTAVRARKTEAALREVALMPGGADNGRLTAAAALVRDEIDPLDDIRGSAEYKREMARVWTERAVRSLLS